MKSKLLECLKNSNQRVDTNKTLALIGALVGAIILIIAALQNYSGLEWIFSAYLVATMGQLPSKGLNDLGRLKLEKETKRDDHSLTFDVDLNDLNEDEKAATKRPIKPVTPKGPALHEY